jgi:large subunit ribosomal protein L7/L12
LLFVVYLILSIILLVMTLSDNAQKVFDLVKQLTALELNELVKALEEEFGVSAAAPVMMSGWSAGAGDEGWSDSVTVELTEIGQQKIGVIKVVKELLWLDLKGAKDLVEKAPVAVKENVTVEEAEAVKAKLEEAGATVSFK